MKKKIAFRRLSNFKPSNPTVETERTRTTDRFRVFH